MSRPTNSRLQSMELEERLTNSTPTPTPTRGSNPVLPLQINGRPNYWAIYAANAANLASQQGGSKQGESKQGESKQGGAEQIDELDQTASILQTQNRYGGFLSALDTVTDMKPKVQSKVQSNNTYNDAHCRGTVNPRFAQVGGTSSNLVSNESRQQYLEAYSFEGSKYKFNNPVLGMDRLGADLDFRQQMMKSTRLDERQNDSNQVVKQ